MLLVLGAGLFWRESGVLAAGAASKYGGDALWALLVFLGFRFISPRSPIWTAAISAVLFSFAVETSQLYHAPWIDAIRRTHLGALTLGAVFNWPDFPAYVLGITIGVIAEETLRRVYRLMNSGFPE